MLKLHHFLFVKLITISLLSNAQLVDIVVEEYGQSTGEYPAGHTTYRVYARLEDPEDFLSAVYGIGEAPSDPNHTLIICDNVQEPGNTTCWNSAFGGVTGPAVNPAFCAVFAETCFDSFITIGRENSASPGNPINVLTSPTGGFNPTFASANEVGIPNPINDGAWFALVGDPNGFPSGPDNRILIMQITCPTGALEFQINLQLFNDGNPNDEMYYCHDLEGPAGQIGGVTEIMSCILVYPVDGFCDWGYIPGCMDESACNYNPTAIIDDGSCVFPGCNDPLAINYNIEAGCDDGSCEYIIPGCIYPLASNFDPEANQNDGSCLFDGCTDPDANNFNPLANHNNGSCDYYVFCLGDLNQDNIVNVGDMLVMIGTFGTTCPD
jgi:hypothetical protein